MGINRIVTQRDHDSRSADPPARTTVTEWPDRVSNAKREALGIDAHDGIDASLV
jgi:hypothetical protein